MVRDEIRASNYNLHRQLRIKQVKSQTYENARNPGKMSPELLRNRNKRSSNNNHEGNQVLQLFEYTGSRIKFNSYKRAILRG
jgi:hypothetical protein